MSIFILFQFAQLIVPYPVTHYTPLALAVTFSLLFYRKNQLKKWASAMTLTLTQMGI